MAKILNGKYTISDESGDLEIRGPSGATILRHNKAADTWEFALPLVDADSGNTIYDTAAEQFGDGNQDADIGQLLSGVAIGDLTDRTSGNTIYDTAAEQFGDGNQDADLNALLSALQILSLTDKNSGNTIYDTAAEQFGDGNQSLDVSDGTVDSAELIGFPSSTSSISPGFDSWTTADADRPTVLLLNIKVQTDGSLNGDVVIDVDESGGTTADYTLEIRASAIGGSGFEVRQTATVPLPPGAQFQIRNGNDPNNQNAIREARQLTF